MPYREKTAWLSLIAIAVTFGPYFTIVSERHTPGALPDLPQLRLFAITVIAQVILQVAGHIYFGVRSPREAKAPPDERDRTINRRSISSAYYVLIVGMILVGCVMPFKSSGWEIINTALLMIVLAEIVRYGVAVFSYRRQAA